MPNIVLKTKQREYTKEDLEKLGIEDLVNLRHYCTRSIAEITERKNQYITENEHIINKSEYWEKVDRYKKAMMHIHNASQLINDLLKTKRCNIHGKEQHWYYMFYSEACKKMPAWILNKLIRSADESCEYTLEEALSGLGNADN